MKNLVLIVLWPIISSTICKGQGPLGIDTAKENVFYNKEFKWKITIPQGFDTVSAREYAALLQAGTKQLEEVTKKQYDEHLLNRICAYKGGGMFNYFEANEAPFDPKTDGDFFRYCKSSDDNVYASYRKIVFPNIKIDTTITTEILDGYTFQKFQLHVVFTGNASVNMFVYSKLFDKKQFTLVVVYFNQKKGELILNAWKNSKFNKS